MGSAETSSAVRVARLHNAFDLRIEKQDAQKVRPGHIAIKPKFCGLCGSDLHFYFHPELADTLKTAHPLTGAALPTPFGHEFSGVVTEVGPDCGDDIKVGDNVTVMPTLTDGDCWACEHGHTNTCAKIGFIGIHGNAGGLGDRAVVPAPLVFKLPEGIDCDVGALIEPLAVAWHSLNLIDKATLTASATILILGGGAVGCAVLLCLRARGINNVIVSEPSADRRTLVLSLGASKAVEPSQIAVTVAELASKSGGVDVAFDCAGIDGRTLNAAVENVRSKGTIVNLALQPATTIPLLAMVMKEIKMQCSLAYTANDFKEVLKAVGDGRINPKPLITKRIRLEDVVAEGLESLHKGEVGCKVLVDMEQ